MSIKDNQDRKIALETKEELGDKIDKLVVMIGKLATRVSGRGRQFNTTNSPKLRQRTKKWYTLHQEIEQERQLNGIDNTSRETNPYKELIVNKTEKIEPLLTQMEQWSIHNSTLNYIQYGRHPNNIIT